MKNFYSIAGLNVEMESFGRTVSQAENYRCDAVEKADIVIKSNRYALLERAPYLGEDSAEYLSFESTPPGPESP